MRNGRESDIFYFDVLDDFYWSTRSEAIAIGDPRDSSDAYGFDIELSAVYTIFDTGSPDILIPDTYYMGFIEQIFARMDGNK